MKFLAEDFIEGVIRRTMLPISPSTFSEDGILEIASEQMLVGVVGRLLSARENFFLTSKLVPITALKQRYPVPERAMGGSLKDFWHVDSSGRRVQPMVQTDTKGLTDLEETARDPLQFLFSGDEIMCFPRPSESVGSLELWFFRRPNRLVKTENCAKITAVSTVGATTTLTVDTDLTADLAVGDLIDFLSAKSPFLSWADDVEITAITSSTIAVAATEIQDDASTTEPQVGDYISVAQTTNIPQIPMELHPLLQQETACVILESLGHLDKLQMAQARLERMIQGTSPIIANRVESRVQVSVARNSILDAAMGTPSGPSWTD